MDPKSYKETSSAHTKDGILGGRIRHPERDGPIVHGQGPKEEEEVEMVFEKPASVSRHLHEHLQIYILNDWPHPWVPVVKEVGTIMFSKAIQVFE